jgi:hypothetical protein
MHSKIDQDAGDSESLLSHSQDAGDEFRPRKKKASLLAIISLLSSHILLALAGGWISVRYFVDRDDLCGRYTSHYCKTGARGLIIASNCITAQIHNDLRIKYSTVNYNGSFFHQTIYRRGRL